MVDREELDRIILSNNTDNWWKPDLFEKNTQRLLPPELEILKNPPDEKNNYNCFIYALGLSDDSGFIKEVKGFVYDTFVNKLISKGELVITKEPKDGDCVVYQDLRNYPEMLTHIGVLHDDKIVSKWAWGPLIKHDLWNVPKSYGDDVFYVEAINSKKALELYEIYKQFNTKPK